jgi:hypothetical protein
VRGHSVAAYSQEPLARLYHCQLLLQCAQCAVQRVWLHKPQLPTPPRRCPVPGAHQQASEDHWQHHRRLACTATAQHRPSCRLGVAHCHCSTPLSMPSSHITVPWARCCSAATALPLSWPHAVLLSTRHCCCCWALQVVPNLTEAAVALQA